MNFNTIGMNALFLGCATALVGCVTLETPGGTAYGPTGNPELSPAEYQAALDDCAGDYVGNYSGELNGGVWAELTPEGVLILDFDAGDTWYTGEGQVTESGLIVGSSSGIISIDGNVHFSDCTASGTWSSNYAGTGTWTAVPN